MADTNEFVFEIYPPWDRKEPIDIYKWKLERHNLLQKANRLRASNMGRARDADGNLLYKINDRAQWKRTKNVTHKTRKEVLARDGHACIQCGSTDSLELDHIVRYVDGGSNESENLQTLCARCHRKKGGR